MVCTDGAAGMVGFHSGVSAKTRKYANKICYLTHCIIHLENSVAQKLSPELNDVMIGAVKIIKYILSHVLHLGLFEALCERMGLQHRHLIFYAEVIRFWKGHVLARLFDLREANKFLRV